MLLKYSFIGYKVTEWRHFHLEWRQLIALNHSRVTYGDCFITLLVIPQLADSQELYLSTLVSDYSACQFDCLCFNCIYILSYKVLNNIMIAAVAEW